MDEYQIEIREVRRTLARVRAAQARPEVIEEYEAELRNLVALYEAATDTLNNRDPRLPGALEELGFGPWELTNVYSFVYEAAMDAELDGRDLANVITHTDYASSILAGREAKELPGGA